MTITQLRTRQDRAASGSEARIASGIVPPFARRLPSTASFFLLASIVVAFLAGSSAPTPLYAVYQAEWGFSPITTTIVFGVYALAVLLALLTVGSLSDYVGRRPVLFVAIVLQAAVMLMFAGAGGVPELLIARVVQGLSTGAAVGAVGAGMLDLNKSKGTVANTVAPVSGTAVGAMGSGLFAQFLPDPTHLIYLVLFVIFVVQAIGVTLMEETAIPRAGALASLKLQFNLPSAARRPLLTAIPVLVAAWALPGFYGSLGPTLVRLMLGSNSFVLGGLALFALAGSAGVTVLLVRTITPWGAMLFGILALLAGVGITEWGVTHTAIVAFFLGTALAGAGFGAGFQSAIRTVLPLAASHERAGVLSIIYVVSYLAMGLPAVLAGFSVVYGGGVVTTAREYGVAVMVLATLALLGMVRPRQLYSRAMQILTSGRERHVPVRSCSLSHEQSREGTTASS